MSATQKDELIETLLKLLRNGKTQTEAAQLLGVNLRTVQRWLAKPDIKFRIKNEQEQRKLLKADSNLLSVVDVRGQLEQIIDYQSSQRNFALEMGTVVQRGTRLLSLILDRLEEEPEQITVKSFPALMRALTDSAEKVSNAWSRATGLDHLLEVIGDEPEADSDR